MKVLFKYSRDIPGDAVVIDTTLGSGIYAELSPFVLETPPAKRFENLWQFSKVYPDQIDEHGNPNNGWFWWRREGFYDYFAHRYPKGKGAIPLYSIYPESGDNRESEHLGYIEARKRIYATFYAKHVTLTESYKRLSEIYSWESDRLVLLDYDAYNHQALNMSLGDVLNNPSRKMGHAFVLMMLLTGEFKSLISKNH